MKWRILPLIAALFLSVSTVFAQENFVRCYTDELLELELQNDPTLKQRIENMEFRLQQFIQNNPDLIENTSGSVMVIPVVVHVIWNTTAQNIPDARIHSQMRVLNEDFRKMFGTPGWNTHPAGADTRFEFRLADRDPQGNPHTGINRVQTSVTSWNPNTQDAQLKALSYWPSQNYLNIWVANLSGGILGYAYLPGTITPTRDGVVILHSAFGHNSPLPPYNLGRTTTHEIGHYINLLHTWGAGSNTGCEGDDGVADTPLCSGQYFSGVPTCPAPTQCGFVRMIENYMDYSDDGCMNIYTEGQRQRMSAAYFTHRTSLWSSFKETINVTQTGMNYDFHNWNNEVFATLNFTSLGSVDTVTVEVWPNLLPLDMPSGSKAVRRFFDIQANGTGFNATLTVHYKDTEVVGFVNGDANLQLYRYEGAGWAYQGGVVNPTANTITLANVSQFSRWAISDPLDNPVPVELTSFASAVDGNNVILNWSTASETNNHGFEIQRMNLVNNVNQWTNVGFVKSHGTSAVTNYYSYKDANLEPGLYNYRLRIVDNDGSYEYSQVVNVEITPPAMFALHQNYPNPFNPSTKISYEIPERGHVTLKIYNALGVEVANPVNGVLEAGIHDVEFDASLLTSGVYFYTLSSGNFTQTKKMVLLR